MEEEEVSFSKEFLDGIKWTGTLKGTGVGCGAGELVSCRWRSRRWQMGPGVERVQERSEAKEL